VSGRLYVGTSGWNYAAWATGFYRGVPRRAWLVHYARRFGAVEVNASFYHEIRPATYAAWRDETPEGFRFCVKAHRYLTHVKRLAFPPESLERQRRNLRALGSKLSVVLWQLPSSLSREGRRLEDFLAALGRWGEARHAVEFRHASWFRSDVAELLASHRVANCLSDAADWPMWDAVTTDLAYVRLHGHTRTYASRYAPRALDAWAARIAAWLGEGRTVHVYFDNTNAGAAPQDALALAARLADAAQH
jgi:uncharacterized protein YecE (DUF72 family)